MRKTLNINQNWSFIKEPLPFSLVEQAKGEEVNLPHTWNGQDGQDGGNDYHRGLCWYVKRFPRPEGERVFLEFQGVNSSAQVFVNGALVKQHDGGYSTFRADITAQLEDENVLCVSADNSPSGTVYPQFADFTFYGGIYRDVNLISVSESHFDLEDHGSAGIYVTPRVSGSEARVTVEVKLAGTKPGQQVRVQIADQSGQVVAEKTQSVDEPSFELAIANVRRWDGLDDPYLYTAKAVLLGGELALDEVSAAFGVREFSVDPDRGFFLNGRSYPLRGVSRHQDRVGKGNALSREDHEEDVRLITEMGANHVRLAHYQHDQYFYDLCDQQGLVVWAEIPFISRYMPEGDENAIHQMNELIRQNYNHASIICWGLSNEITMSGESERLVEFHKQLNDICHQLDPTRLTAIANVSMLPIESPMNKIADVISYNIYYGWYAGKVEDNAPWLDSSHAQLPGIALGISEYGCEAILKWHTSEPKCGDYSEEYQAFYHEEMLKAIAERPYIWATAVWNMFDFGSDMRDEGGLAGKNHKGLVTFDRKVKKDSYFIYKAWWSKEKFVHLCGRRYIDRAEAVTRVKVYSNCDAIELYANGELVGQQRGAHMFTFDVKLNMGENTIVAKSGELRDEIILKRVEQPNPNYILPFGGKEIENWFDNEGNKVIFEFPEGYYSVKDSIDEIFENPAGREIVQRMIDTLMGNMAGAGMDMSADIMKMLGNQSVERLFGLAGMSGKKFPKELLLQMNQRLTQIKKG